MMCAAKDAEKDRNRDVVELLNGMIDDHSYYESPAVTAFRQRSPGPGERYLQAFKWLCQHGAEGATGSPELQPRRGPMGTTKADPAALSLHAVAFCEYLPVALPRVRDAIHSELGHGWPMAKAQALARGGKDKEAQTVYGEASFAFQEALRWNPDSGALRLLCWPGAPDTGMERRRLAELPAGCGLRAGIGQPDFAIRSLRPDAGIRPAVCQTRRNCGKRFWPKTPVTSLTRIWPPYIFSSAWFISTNISTDG